VGFTSSAVVVGFAFVKESVPVVFSGIAAGVCNMGMEMGPMILQPVIGWILDLKWNGVSENGIRIYDLNAYHIAFGVMIGLSLLGALIIAFARETYCRQLEERYSREVYYESVLYLVFGVWLSNNYIQCLYRKQNTKHWTTRYFTNLIILPHSDIVFRREN